MLVTAKPEDVGLSSERLDRIGPWMDSYIDAGKLPGGLALVARRGQVVYCQCRGLRDIEADLPVEEDTIFRFYSMSKPVTSTAIMMLYEQGHFQLDDPIAGFLPEFTDMQVYVSGEGAAMRTEPARDPITFRHLLTHTGGLTYGFFEATPVDAAYRQNNVEFNGGRGGHGDLAANARRLADQPLLTHPGEEWNYSVSTDLLGRLVEVISGQPLDEYFQQRILGPLGMTDTSFSIAPEKQNRFAANYGHEKTGPLKLLDAPGDSSYQDVKLFSGGGGLTSTARDYHRFTQMLRGKGEFEGVRLLGRKTVEYMTTNHLPNNGDLTSMGQAVFSETSYDGVGFGLGFSVMLDPAKAQVIGSPGEYAWGGAASTAFWIDPVEDMSVIFLTQLMPSSTYPLRRELKVLTYQALIG
ncbi:MAG: beta-lactamase family protein [Alphaproteobacteria bacterium]|nr:beta-lactamase family protein [Alphaproteobacteria bacterium]